MSSQSSRKTIIGALLCTFACVLLMACAGGTLPGAQPTNTFEGRAARDASELNEYVEKAAQAGGQRKDNAPKKKEDGDLTKELQDELADANDAYKKGDYATAEASYNKIIEEHPTNYGANVNLTLALLRQDRNEEALVQALTCVYLFPEDTGPALNAQVTGVALGFDIKDINSSVESLAKDQDGSFDLSATSSDYADDLTYNLLWDRIDTELHDEATGKEKPTSGDYDILREELADLLHKRPDDEDVLALVKYFDAAANKLGFETSGLLDEKSNEETEAEKADSSSSSSKKDGSSSSSSSSKKDSSSSSSKKEGSSSSSSSSKKDSSSSPSSSSKNDSSSAKNSK